MQSPFYGKLYAESYDAGTESQEIIDFYLTLWKRLGKLNPVLEAGAEIDGLDSSPYMLALCKKKLEARMLDADLYEQSIQEMALPRQYQFIFIPDRSFAHIYEKTMAQECLKRFGDHLLPGGYVVFDVKSLAQLSIFGEPGQADFGVEDQSDGSTIFSTGVWGAVEDGCVVRMWNKYEKYVDGKLVETEIFDYRERLYARIELEAMLGSAGFTDISVTKSYEHSEPGDDDGLVFICRKT